jgi:hypothetical protein
MIRKNVKKILFMGVVAAILAGCSDIGTKITKPKSRWSPAQKNEFIEILEEDRYSSVCDLTPMIEQYKETKDEKILTNILIRYTENLANSCIDIDYFKRKLDAKRAANKINTHYEFYEEYVSEGTIMRQLENGESIESILSTYVPQTPQFKKLIYAYSYTESPDLRAKIKLNIERTKLFQPEGWDTYVLVNVPEFKFRFFENGEKVLEFKVIVGKPTWQTPIFSSMLKYITVNPTWNVPDNIARKEIIPRIVKDINYLKRNNMVVKRDYGLDSPTVDPRKVNWKEYLKPEWEFKELPYKIIERSSTRNALGRVKFMFPNRFSVYMHDTNNKKLFRHSQRAFSHGCIRLEKPLKFLGHLATYYTKQKFDQVEVLLKAKKTKYIGLKEHIPVHIVYLTAYAEDGGVRFFNDIYGFDKITRLRLYSETQEVKAK